MEILLADCVKLSLICREHLDGNKVFQLLLLFFHKVACPIALQFGMFASTFGFPSALKNE